MNNKLAAYCFLAVFGCFSAVSAQMGGNYKWNNPSSSLPSGITHSTYHSTLMNTDIGYNIYLPPNYNSSTDRYPVIYSLHGMGGNEGSNCQNYSGIGSMISSNEIQPSIVVFVNGRGNTFYSDAKNGSVKCESSIINELIPHIDSTYRTKADRTGRAIEGISMGGFGTLMLGFKHPDIFGSIGTYDAALVTWDTINEQQFDQSIPKDIFGSDEKYFTDNCYPHTFLTKNADTIKALGIKVRMITGDNDVQMGPLYNYNCAMRDSIKAHSISLDFKIIPGGTHGSGMSATTVKENLIFHSNNLKELATGISTMSIHRQAVADAYCRSGIFSSMSAFRIPSQWQKNASSAVLHDLTGRRIGQIPVNSSRIIDGKSVQEKSGSGIYLVKAGKK